MRLPLTILLLFLICSTVVATDRIVVQPARVAVDPVVTTPTPVPVVMVTRVLITTPTTEPVVIVRYIPVVTTQQELEHCNYPYECLSNASADAKFGMNNYDLRQLLPCGEIPAPPGGGMPEFLFCYGPKSEPGGSSSGGKTSQDAYLENGRFKLPLPGCETSNMTPVPTINRDVTGNVSMAEINGLPTPNPTIASAAGSPGGGVTGIAIQPVETIPTLAASPGGFIDTITRFFAGLFGNGR